jgi:acyl dehydratase
MTRQFGSLTEFEAAVGEELGTSSWLTVTQKKVDLFADATDDHQWIHLDPERAATGQFGRTVAHGYLTLSLLSALTMDIYSIDGLGLGINYGTNRVRFPAPVPVGSRVRATATLIAVHPGSAGTQATISCVVECDDASKPVCVAEVVHLYSASA